MRRVDDVCITLNPPTFMKLQAHYMKVIHKPGSVNFYQFLKELTRGEAYRILFTKGIQLAKKEKENGR